MTEVPTFNVIAATGAAGSQSDYWGGSVTATQSGASWLTGKYWEITDPGITSFYASNAALTFNAAGPTVTLANCNTDVVAAHCDSPSYASSNDLSFNHILTRLGSITLNTQSGYELSAVSATLTDGCTAGTYNLRTGAWSSLGARSAVAAGAFSGNTSAQTSANDKWFVPGSYTFSVSYTLTKGDYVQSFTKTGTVTLVAGKKNNLTATAVGGSAQEIVFNVSVTDWNANAIEMEWDPELTGTHMGHDWVDLGLRLDGNKILFATTNIGADSPEEFGDYFAWGETSKRYTSINSSTGAISGGNSFSTQYAPYHTGSYPYIGWTKYFEDDGLVTLEETDDAATQNWGGDWRTPTFEELRLCCISLSTEWRSDYNSSGHSGMIIHGKDGFASSIFVPTSGECVSNTRYLMEDGYYYGNYWSSSLVESDIPCAYALNFNGDSQMLQISETSSRYKGYTVRPVLVVPE